jgi:hypothetical protein
MNEIRTTNLHLIISSISRPEHLTLFEFGIAEKWTLPSLLAARSIEDLVAWSGGLDVPSAKFRSW